VGSRAEWQHVADRIEALDGLLSVDASAAGTRLTATVPVVGADSRTTPRADALT
jgi:hypothetical protein